MMAKHNFIFLVLSFISQILAAKISTTAKKDVAPNFVFILTDDQDRLLGESGYTSLGSLEIMPNLRSKLIDEGAIVDNFLVNTPICCPSRTEFFTGRYFHNAGGPEIEKCMHADTSLAGSSEVGLFGVLKNNGYNVGIFGKVTNDQEKILNQMSGEEKSVTYVDAPNGHEYHNFTTNEYWRYWAENDTTTVEIIDSTDPVFGSIYQTSQLGNRTLRWLDAIGEESKPFFAYIGPHAPHFPAQPAPWYEHTFDEVNAPITPNYNVESPDKAQHIRQNPPLDERARCWENQHFRDRWGSLLSVDDLINDLYDYLEAHMLLENTYIIYSSDHGYKQGQWRIGNSLRLLNLKIAI